MAGTQGKVVGRPPPQEVTAPLKEPGERSDLLPGRSPAAPHGPGMLVRMVTIDDVRAVASALPRAYEVLVRDQVKFRVGRIVFLAFSADETRMGFGFPKEEREALVASEPDKFLMPLASDMRYNWVRCRLAALGKTEMRELVVDAWRMCVPKKVAAEYLATSPAKSRRPKNAGAPGVHP